MDSISLVFPAFNEEENIGKVLEDAISIAEKLNVPFEIVVVNDGSIDKTPEIVKSYIKKYPKIIKLINNYKNLGYGATLRNGFKTAKNDWVFFADSDRQFDLNEIHNLLEYTNNADIIIGYRKNRQDKFIRKVNAGIFKIIVRGLFNIKVKDIDCAFKLINKKVLDNVNLVSNGALINTELIHKSYQKQYKIIEVPVNHYPRIAGKASGAKISVILKAVRELLTMRIFSY